MEELCGDVIELQKVETARPGANSQSSSSGQMRVSQEHGDAVWLIPSAECRSFMVCAVTLKKNPCAHILEKEFIGHFKDFESRLELDHLEFVPKISGRLVEPPEWASVLAQSSTAANNIQLGIRYDA